MKKFILLLARIFKVNVIDGDIFERKGDRIFLKGDLFVKGGVTMYSYPEEFRKEMIWQY